MVLLVTLLTETNFDQFKLGVGLGLELFQLVQLLGREIFWKESLPSSTSTKTPKPPTRLAYNRCQAHLKQLWDKAETTLTLGTLTLYNTLRHWETLWDTLIFQSHLACWDHSEARLLPRRSPIRVPKRDGPDWNELSIIIAVQQNHKTKAPRSLTPRTPS